MHMLDFQEAVYEWCRDCFGIAISRNRAERSARFIEEALELVQAAGFTKGEVLQLVDYVYNRPVGDIRQEVGGVMVTLSALCSANDIALGFWANRELDRINTRKEQIREKQKNKPRNSPLPE